MRENAVRLANLMTGERLSLSDKPSYEDIMTVIMPIKERVTAYRVAKAFKVTPASAYRWFKGNGVSQARLEQLKVLLGKIELWEKIHGKRFGT